MNMNHWRKMGWKKIMDNKKLSITYVIARRFQAYIMISLVSLFLFNTKIIVRRL